MKPTHILAAVLTASFVFIATVAHAAESRPNDESARRVDFYVSPGGQDTNPGTVEKPFASIERARNAVRAAKAKITDRDLVVRILPGTHYLEKPVVFGARRLGLWRSADHLRG